MGRNREGRRTLSQKSNRAEFTIINPPPVPSLSADPSEPLYLVGENISLRCSAPNNVVQSWRQYLFSQIRKNENEISIKDLDCHEENSLVLTVTRDDSGLYKCRYLEQKYGRTISSEWSRPVSIVVRDPLPPPVLKLHPPSGSLREGKVLQILCVPNEGNSTKRFHFSWKGVEMASSSEGLLRSSRDSGLLTLNMSVAFLYANGDGSLGLACRYEENINGRWIMSSWSQTVNITGSQTDSSRSAPRLSSSLPHSFIIKGEEIPLNCSLPEGVASWSPEGSHRFFFYCKDQSGKSVGGQHLPNNTVNIRTENLTSDQIKIICNCKIRETSWGWPSSPESNQLVFSVVDELPSPPSPLLKVDPVSQVKEGDPLVFLCSVEGSNAEKIFHFYKDGMEITSREEGLLEPSIEPTDRVQSASLRILHASFNHSGEFACSYEEKRTNQWLVSSWSQGINMTVIPVWTHGLYSVWRYARRWILFLILLVPIAFYCWKQKSTSQSQEQFQLMEKKEKGDHLSVMEPQVATPSSVKFPQDFEATYSNVQDFSTQKNHLTEEEEEGAPSEELAFILWSFTSESQVREKIQGFFLIDLFLSMFV
ncbi:uncharacterized protein LOC120305649 [Crotalus tigris]|uniref:uncharacterized protein LOC120305649 n=1 Tax=Crotalus tigris TaxID=88082 RepID=UPI00192F927D|nr:uncharacterized protein LOC120305649 [Crotalus tigris]